MQYHRTFNKKKQQGAVLLLLMFAVIIGFATLFITAYNNDSIQIQNDDETTEALGKAKEAVLNYVTANYHLYQPGEYGFLPCPDKDAAISFREGVEHKNCLNSHINDIGHLPWRSLGLPPFKDSTGQCLWYVVTGLDKKQDINDIDTGLIELYGPDRTTKISDSSDPFVAAIIAPKSALSYQARTATNQNIICEQSYDPSDYLDTTTLNTGGGSQVNNSQLNGALDTADIFITSSKSSQDTLAPYSQQNPQPYNDQIIYITRDELIAAITKAGEITPPPATEADLDESTAQVTFANDIENFDVKRGNALHTATPNGEDSELLIYKGIAPLQQYFCLWYNEPFELENKTLRTFFKLKLQEDNDNFSLGRCSGLTFTITPGPATSCGNGGANLGFAGMPGPLANRSFAVEYDIAPSITKNDPFGNHIAVVTRSHNTHGAAQNSSCPGSGCYIKGTSTQDEVTWLEDLEEHSTRIEIHTGYTTSDCTDGDSGNGGDYAKVNAWVDCPVGTCENFGKLDSDYTDAGNTHLISQCIDYPSQMNGDPDEGDNGIRFGFTGAIGGCYFGPTLTNITLSEFGLTIE